MKFLPNNFTKMYKFWIKTGSFGTQKCTSWSRKMEKFVLFTLKMKFLPKTFHQNVQILDKNCRFVPKNVHFVMKNQTICTFYSKNEVFAKQIHQKCTNFGYKTGVWYPKMYSWFRKMEKFVLFTLIMKFLPTISTKMYKFWIKTCSFVH